jgi:hypothetical protein
MKREEEQAVSPRGRKYRCASRSMPALIIGETADSKDGINAAATLCCQSCTEIAGEAQGFTSQKTPKIPIHRQNPRKSPQRTPRLRLTRSVDATSAKYGSMSAAPCSITRAVSRPLLGAFGRYKGRYDRVMILSSQNCRGVYLWHTRLTGRNIVSSTWTSSTRTSLRSGAERSIPS